MKYLYRVCWVRPYYALLGLLGLCVLTVLVSLLYLEDAALKLPHSTRLQAAAAGGAPAAPLHLSHTLPPHPQQHHHHHQQQQQQQQQHQPPLFGRGEEEEDEEEEERGRKKRRRGDKDGSLPLQFREVAGGGGDGGEGRGRGGGGGVGWEESRGDHHHRGSEQRNGAGAAERQKDLSGGQGPGAVERQAWPDHKKESRRLAAGGLAGGGGGAGGEAGVAPAAIGGGGGDGGGQDIKVLNNLEIVVQNLSLLNRTPHHHHQQKESTRLGVVAHSDGSIVIPPHLLAARSDQSASSWSGAASQRKRYIIYLCTGNMTCCGWGDRQHGILSAYLISLVTNRTFGVEMTSPCPIGLLFHHRILNWRVNVSALAGLTSRHIYSVNDIVFRQVMQMVDFNSVYPEDVVYLTTNYDYFYALKANPHYTQVFRKQVHGKPRPLIFANLWQNIFKLNKRVQRRIDQALKLARPTPRHKLVCGHVRLGRNPSIPNDSEVRNTLQTIRPLWNFLNHFKDPGKYRIFVPSDSEAVREKVLDMFPGQAVDVKGEIMHIDKTRVVHNDACTGFEKVLADQYLLATCDVLVLTYSVFGKSAAYMRRSNHDLYFMENGAINPLQLFKEKTTDKH